MEGTMGHLRWSRYPLVPLVWRFTIMGDLPYSKKKKRINIGYYRNRTKMPLQLPPNEDHISH